MRLVKKFSVARFVGKRKVGVMVVKLLQKLNFLQPLECFHEEILLIDLCPDDDEKHPSRYRDEAKDGAEMMLEADQKMEEETGAAKDEGQDEHEVDNEPGNDQAAAGARGGDHKEDRGDEAEHQGDQDPGEDGGGGGGADDEAGDDPGVGEDEDEDGGAAEEEILDTQTRPQHLQSNHQSQVSIQVT